jgi:hypothetical protein
MAVPIGFIRNKNPNLNLRGALKIDAIFATDNDLPGTEAFQGWLANNNVVTSFNDALIQNKIGVVDTEGFNISAANRFAFTTMSEGKRVNTKELILVRFQNSIDPSKTPSFVKGQYIDFESNGQPFGSVIGPSNGKGYEIFSVYREKDILVNSIATVQDGSNWIVTIQCDPKEDLQEFSASTSTGNNYQDGDHVVISGITPTAFNGSYDIFNVTSTGFSYILPSNPGTYQFGGKFYLATKELLLTEVNRATSLNSSWASGTFNINLSGAIVQGRILEGQFVTSASGGISSGTTVVNYSNITNTLTLSNVTTAARTNVTLEFAAAATNDIVIPTGAIVPDFNTRGLEQPEGLKFANAGSVVESFAIKSPINYYVYGDSRLKYFWSTFDSRLTNTVLTQPVFDGWSQNFLSDGFSNLYNNANPQQGVTAQLIGDGNVFATEDTFNNVVKTLGVDRGSGTSFNDDYTPQGRSALLYISATDSQGLTGASGGRNRGTSTPAYSVSEAITAVRDNRGYWVGVIGGSFTSGCQNEIQTFRKDSTDGILGDPRGFVPIKGEVTSLRVGAAITSVSYNSGTSEVTCTTYYDHKLGNNGATRRVRIKNAPRAVAMEGLRDVTILTAKTFKFVLPINPVSSAKVDFDDYGYVLDVTSLLTVPSGFYRKSTLKYVNSMSTLNDSRTLASPPGIGLDRKNILVTLRVTETTGTLQFFSSYPIGDFFIGLPETPGGGTNYYAYPGDGRDIKFKVNVTNQGSLEYIQTTLLNSGTDEVSPREEFFTTLYVAEFTADVIGQNINGNQITVNNINIFNNGGEGRDFTILNTGGSGYNNGILTGDPPEFATTFAADDVTTTPTSGTGSGLKFNIQVISGAITSVVISDRGSGYKPGDTGQINAPTGGNVTTKATYTVKNISDDQTLELSFNISGGVGSGDPGLNLNLIPTLIGINSITANPTPGEYVITLNKNLGDTIIGEQVSFTYPNDNRRVSIFVKPSNNFKDISVTPASIAANPALATSDAFITFSGYGYTEQDVLTPSEVTNAPATITNAVYTSDTKISVDGFLYEGQSIIGTQSFIKSGLTGDFAEGGVGAAFNIKQTAGGTYNVSILDQGSNFSVGEKIVVPGAELNGGIASATFVSLQSNGTGYTDGTYTNIAATTNVGSGLTLNFDVIAGSIDPTSVEVNNGGTGIPIETTGTITGISNTSPATFTVESTLNDLVITVTKVDDNSRVTLTTQNPHNFVPPLGRTTIDILVEGITSTLSTGKGFNGRFTAEVADSVTLVYNISYNPGTRISGGTAYNVSVDVVNDTFASFSNKLFFNINQPTNDPVYPYIRFINNATYNGVNVSVETTAPHGLSINQEVRVSGIRTSRAGSDWNSGKAIVLATGFTATTFSYAKVVGGGNPGVYVSGGEVTNPYVKVLGGIYTKDFNRIIFVNTKDTPQDGIPSDKTQDFLVRDINFRQISNDGFNVQDGPKHNFYILNSNTLAITRRLNIPITSITYIPESLEYEVTCSQPHGLWEGNAISIAVTGGTPSPIDPDLYNTPTGNVSPDEVTLKVSDTVFRYTVYRIGRDPATPVSITSVTGTVNKPIGVGTGDEDIFVGPTNAGNARDIVKFTGLTGAPGISNEKFYYIVNAEQSSANNTSYITFRLSNTKNGAPISFSLDISSATYNRSLEKAIIQVPGTTPHGLLLGNEVNITGVSSQAYNGLVTLTDIISPTIFAYSLPASQGIPDTTNQSITKVLRVGTPGSVVTKRVEASLTNLRNLVIRTTGGGDTTLKDIAVGMRITTATTGVGSSGVALPNSATTVYLVTGWNPSTRTITIDRDIAAAITVNNANCEITLSANVTGSKAIAFTRSVDATPGTYTGLNQVQVGQRVNNGTTTAIPTGAEIMSVYSSTQDIPGTTETNTYYMATLDLPLTGNIINLQTVTVNDNLASYKSIRLRNFTGTPLIGSEIVNVDGSNNTIPTFETGTTITSVKTYTVGATSGYIIGVSNDLLTNLTTGTVKVYPNSNAGSGGTVTGKVATITSDVINNQNTDLRGQTQLTADVAGWDHVALARDTGGALFFQLGFVKTCAGAFGDTTITATNTTDLNLVLPGYGVYGDGVAPGATVVGISGGVITLSNPNVGIVNGYVGFARPSSVSIFPKYTQEFGRILGKTFAEWLFKIA